MLRYEDIAELVRIIDSSSCAEFVLDTAELKLTLRRHGTVGPIASVPTPSAPTAAPRAAPMIAPTQNATAPMLTGHQTVEAPMIGTFYAAPAPGQPPFVQPGSQVAAGDKLCLIEVMKLYTTIFAPVAGIIREICAQDGELVEYGQALFVIEAGSCLNG
jgi:acetyl-CoA carboxylase biotin carboxyl carrier protein